MKKNETQGVLNEEEIIAALLSAQSSDTAPHQEIKSNPSPEWGLITAESQGDEKDDHFDKERFLASLATQLTHSSKASHDKIESNTITTDRGKGSLLVVPGSSKAAKNEGPFDDIVAISSGPASKAMGKDHFEWKDTKDIPRKYRSIEQQDTVLKVDDTRCPLTCWLRSSSYDLRCLLQFNEAQLPKNPHIYDIDTDSDGSDYSLQKLSGPFSSEYYIPNIHRGRGNSETIDKFPAVVAHRRHYKNGFPKHNELKKAMNRYQENAGDDLLAINMNEKANSNKKWTVIGVIDPDKHLSTLDHSVNMGSILKTEGSFHSAQKTGKRRKIKKPQLLYGSVPDSTNAQKVAALEIINYHHWIPSVFRANKEGTECELLSEIPNLDPYECGDTLYPLIEELFLYQLPQFENVLDLNLRDVPLRVIVKAQDYQLDDCKEQDYYLGNFHKEGLYEDIMAVGLYYYHIDEDIKGGELQLSSLIEIDDDAGSHYGYGRRRRRRNESELRHFEVPVTEGMSVVFSNDLCYHRVQKIHGNGSRKIIAFFLMRMGSDLTVNVKHPIDAGNICVNLKYHAFHFVKRILREMQKDGNEWLISLILEYVVGDPEYIARARAKHRHCQMVLAEQIRTVSHEMGRLPSRGRD